MNFSNFKTEGRTFKSRAAAIALAVASGGVVTGLVAASFISVPANAAAVLQDVRTAIELRLPRTPITSLTCKGFGGLCEVVSEKTLFYIDERARYLFVGRLYDMESRADLTAAKLLELNPDLLVAGSAGANDTGPTASKQPAEERASKVPVADLTPSGAVHWGGKSGPNLIVFSDFLCSYCKRLTAELKKAHVRVEERPISILGEKSRKLAEAVICSSDPAKALHQAYSGETPKPQKSCDTSGLDANEAFARSHGFSGTPVMVRASDGAVLEGYRGASEIRAFLGSNAKGAK
ncbi:disulfide bond formation protein DsbC [Sphingopyxis sp. BSNA05]|uniref:DsbC family protein n=1 Tax=Sphingopyxis sp. BSNA05 TaxID=1236614 RepID=UPI0015630835|nr:disulfide bond formation protein DsbC [Sphingopyxis sp. BSNA05]